MLQPFYVLQVCRLTAPALCALRQKRNLVCLLLRAGLVPHTLSKSLAALHYSAEVAWLKVCGCRPAGNFADNNGNLVGNNNLGSFNGQSSGGLTLLRSTAPHMAVQATTKLAVPNTAC